MSVKGKVAIVTGAGSGICLLYTSKETRMFIENITLENIHFTSNHVSNYLPLKGTLSQDKDRLLAEIDRGIKSGEGVRSKPPGGRRYL